MKRWITGLLAGALALGVWTAAAAAPDASPPPADTVGESGQEQALSGAYKYEEYLARHEGAPAGAGEILIQGSGYASAQDMPGAAKTADGAATQEQGAVTWEFNAPAEGMYQLEARYFPTPGKGGSIERSILINGALPYAEAGNVLFHRVWADKDRDYQTQKGNQSFPTQVEAPVWMEAPARDVNGFYDQPLQFYLEKGKNTVSLVSLREPMEVGELRFVPAARVPSYEEYLAERTAAGAAEVADASVVVQAEDAAGKSSPSLYPVNDRSSVMTTPYHPSNIVLNTIGGKPWSEAGDWISWELDVPESGLYRIVTRFRQNEARGTFTTRRVEINGETPFAEAADIRFPYNGHFQVAALGSPEGEPYLFYLEQGKNTIKMEATLGVVAGMVRRVEDVTQTLNNLYRDISVITGSTPDKYQDYKLTARLPALVPTVTEAAAELRETLEDLRAYMGGNSDKTAVISKALLQLEEIGAEPDTLAVGLPAFKDNVTALGKWSLDVKGQPLKLDMLMLAGSGTPLPKAEGNIFQNMVHSVRMFAGSFTNDFTPEEAQLGDGAPELEVWVTTGRDQMEIIRRLINESFERQAGVRVNLKLVSADVLLPATFTGRGPDVAIQVGSTLPVNFALRGAAYDLTEFSDFSETSAQFLPGAMDYFRYDGGVYALPDQMSFPVVFYRKDILSELGIPIPDTWDDVISAVPYLQKNNMEFYLDTATQLTLGSGTSIGNSKAINSVFLSMLFQNGGSIYSPEGDACLFNSTVGTQTFKKWTEFYTRHGFPVEADFVTRFRIGEVPIGVVDFTTYSKLAVSAPEIRGQWDIAPAPGTLQPDGTIRRDTPCVTSAAVMVSGTVEKRGTAQPAWEFIKWWTGAQTQNSYARGMESILGPAARYPVANLEAFSQMPWPAHAMQVLNESLPYVRGVEQVPGSYITGRYLDNAFREVINQDANPTDTLYDQTDLIDRELLKKREEFARAAS